MRALGSFERASPGNAKRKTVIATFFVLLQLGAANGASSGRPVECSFGDTGRPNVWERVKQPELGRYCDLLASGASKLASATGQPREVIGIADDADKRLPGRAAPTVLKGRAFAKLAQYTEAYTAFHAALTLDPSACDEPNALYAYARSAARTSHDADALTAFRALLPRASGLAAQDRGAAYFEAGLVNMAKGASSLDDAIAIFRQARREAQDAIGTAAWLALALALDRSGVRDEARAILAERTTDAKTTLADGRVRDVLSATPAELDALTAMSLELADPVAARAAWHKYSASASSGPWAEHALAKEVALANAKAKPKPK